MSSLDIYKKALSGGLVSENSAGAAKALESSKKPYEDIIESAYERIDESNRKIGAWRTEKTTADKYRKKVLASYIAAEQELITAARAEIAQAKREISAINEKISGVSKRKPASYYIEQGVNQSRSYYTDKLSMAENDYDVWYSRNKDTATPEEIIARKRENINTMVQIEKEFIDDLNLAYEKLSEIYGEDSVESVDVKEIISQRLLAIENLEKSYEDMGEVIEDALSDRKKNYESDIENADLIYKLWELTQGSDAPDYKKRAENIKSLNRQLKEQEKLVVDTAQSYREMVKMYGINAAESEKLENQLISECVAYETLVGKIKELYAVEDYDRKDREDIIFGLNDYLKKNKEFLLSTGMTEEEIYKVARDATGYSDLFEYTVNKTKGQDYISSGDIIQEIISGVLEDVFEDIPKNFFGNSIPDTGVLEETFSDFGGLIQLLGGIEVFMDALNSVRGADSTGDSTYTSVYNLVASHSESIADQIHAIKKYEEIKKARGLD